MKPRSYSTEGIILARHDYSDADRILRIYTKKFGKLGVLAKGIKGQKVKSVGMLEIFNKINYSAVRSPGLDIMTEAMVIDQYGGIRGNLKKISVAYFFLEVVDKITKEEEQNDDFYNLLCSYLDKLELSVAPGSLRKKFIEDSLVVLGFWPEGIRPSKSGSGTRECSRKEAHYSPGR